VKFNRICFWRAAVEINAVRHNKMVKSAGFINGRVGATRGSTRSGSLTSPLTLVDLKDWGGRFRQVAACRL
jgi:hypothetical protein